MRQAATEVSDEVLIRGFLKGNAEDFNVIYERYRRQLYSYLNKLLSEDRGMVDDLFQQTWLKAINQFEKYEDREKCLAWLARIAHNLAMDHFRARKRRPEESADELALESLSSSALESPLRQLQSNELDSAIDYAVRELSPELREVFLLRQNDVAFRDIAEIQNCSINTVLARMQYALKNLRKSLAGWNGGRKGVES